MDKLWMWAGWGGFALLAAAYARLFRSSGARNLRRMEAALAAAADQMERDQVRIGELDEMVTQLRLANDKQQIAFHDLQMQNLDLMRDKRTVLQAVELKTSAIERLVRDLARQELELKKARNDIEQLQMEITKLKAQNGQLG